MSYSSVLKIMTAKYPLFNDCIATKKAIEEINIEIEIMAKALKLNSDTGKALKEVLRLQLENADLNRCQNLFTSQKINELSVIIGKESKKFETEISAQTGKSNKLVLYIGGSAILLGFILILIKGK